MRVLSEERERFFYLRFGMGFGVMLGASGDQLVGLTLTCVTGVIVVLGSIAAYAWANWREVRRASVLEVDDQP